MFEIKLEYNFLFGCWKDFWSCGDKIVLDEFNFWILCFRWFNFFVIDFGFCGEDSMFKVKLDFINILKLNFFLLKEIKKCGLYVNINCLKIVNKCFLDLE